ncbi:dipeptidyl peptidase S46 family protein [Luteimonas padinae]|uniref:Dipeptidyl-peptidase n=1 Tax=Luteimonas padinae TaxID=1714359 RepID=A0ABV6STU3_9GAMM|nr:S46 family peptidase [Luteimonas padinae]GHD70378.1 dipeptidyl peptidase S46 family protein [Luteimonas padinae]
MRPSPVAAALAALLLSAPVVADEGMWLPSQLPEVESAMRDSGFQGDPGSLSDLSKPPMSAVVSLGGCTASFVSPQGLVVTNHHCAHGAIQLNSTPENNLIDDGFNAATMADELSAGPGARVLVTDRFERITDRILADARGTTGRAYHDAVEAASKAAVAECEAEAPGYRCSVVDMYYGTDFHLVRQLEIRDVRLAYAPPDAIGSYGDEIDNFMWPRHSGDFTFYRAYVGPDGRPAAFSPDNVPFKPAAWLTVSTDPLAEGDFAMLAGYPGRTFRHRSAAEFADQVEWQLPSRVELMTALLAAIERGSAGSADAEVRYAAQVASLKNTLKRAQGELDGLRRSDAVAERRRQEAAMSAWLAGQPDAAATRADIDAASEVIASARATRERDQLFALMQAQTQLLGSAMRLQRLALERGKPDAEREGGYQLRDEARIEAALRQAQRRYAPEVERAILAELLARHRALPADQRVPEIEQVFGTDAAATDAALESLYADTALASEDERLRLLAAAPAEVQASTDPLMRAAARLQQAVLRFEDADKARAGELLRLRPAYMRGMIGHARSEGRAVYPDANSTLRVSYGRIESLQPRDAVSWAPLTTVEGIVEKHTGVAPFDAPGPLLDAIARRDFGATADPGLGTQTVNFLTNLDTTGGNSGSPVMDARGRLIGLNFDSNWEAVSASWKFDPRYKRAIHVDARYMRWIMARVYPAPQLLAEMGLPLDGADRGPAPAPAAGR